MSSDEQCGTSGEEWQPEEAQPATPVRKSNRNLRNRNYLVEKCDETFSAYPGITHFGRTRKGGDRRPRSKQKPASISKHVTILNFFGVGDATPLPLPLTPAANTTKKKKKASRRTRTLYGRPQKAKADDQQERVRKLKTKVQVSKAAGTLAVPPQKRRKWNGTVRTICIL